MKTVRLEVATGRPQQRLKMIDAEDAAKREDDVVPGDVPTPANCTPNEGGETTIETICVEDGSDGTGGEFVLFDDFERSVGDGWGTGTLGQEYDYEPGDEPFDQAFVNAGEGQILITSSPGYPDTPHQGVVLWDFDAGSSFTVTWEIEIAPILGGAPDVTYHFEMGGATCGFGYIVASNPAFDDGAIAFVHNTVSENPQAILDLFGESHLTVKFQRGVSSALLKVWPTAEAEPSSFVMTGLVPAAHTGGEVRVVGPVGARVRVKRIFFGENPGAISGCTDYYVDAYGIRYAFAGEGEGIPPEVPTGSSIVKLAARIGSNEYDFGVPASFIRQIRVDGMVMPPASWAFQPPSTILFDSGLPEDAQVWVRFIV